jgi:hypothetical protein
MLKKFNNTGLPEKGIPCLLLKRFKRTADEPTSVYDTVISPEDNEASFTSANVHVPHSATVPDEPAA